MHEDNRIILLSRDPNWLYAYWNITEDKIKALIGDIGPGLWEKSVPVLKVYNLTTNESFFVRINDFSNNWYIGVPNSNSVYMVEIGRKISEQFFICLLNSNSTVAPGNEISSDTTVSFVNYMDLKSGKPVFDAKMSWHTQSQDLQSLSSSELYGIDLKG